MSMGSRIRPARLSSRAICIRGTMRSTGSRLLAVIRVFLGALLLTQTVGGANRPKYGGTLRVELYAGSFSLDPPEWEAGDIRAGRAGNVGTVIYDRLAALDDDGRFEPALATEWSHDAAGKIWQFKLRPGVKFSNGSLLTPSDVVNALQRLLPPPLEILPGENGLTIRASRPVPD